MDGGWMYGEIAEAYIGGFRFVGICVEFRDGVPFEPLLLLIFISLTNSGGCRHIISYCVVWFHVRPFYLTQVFRTACLCLLQGVQFKSGPYLVFTKIYNVLYYTTNLNLQ